MRIALITDKNLENTDGVATQLLLQKSRLEKLGCRVAVFGSSMQVFEKSGDIKKADVLLIATREKFRKKALRLAKSAKKPVVFEEFWDLPAGRNKTATAARKNEMEFLNECNAVIVPTSEFGEKLVDNGLKKPVSVVSAWLNDRELRVKYPVRKFAMPERLKIFWKGDMSVKSGIMDFLCAVNELDTEVECEVFVFGSGEKFKEATKFVDKHKMRVRFLGEVSRGEIQKCMKECHIGVYSGMNEVVMPTEILEMKVAGLPIIVKEDRYMNYLTNFGGVLCTKKSIMGMSEMIQNFMRMPSVITDMSKKNLRDKSDILYASQGEMMLEIFDYLTKNR